MFHSGTIETLLDSMSMQENVPRVVIGPKWEPSIVISYRVFSSTFAISIASMIFPLRLGFFLIYRHYTDLFLNVEQKVSLHFRKVHGNAILVPIELLQISCQFAYYFILLLVRYLLARKLRPLDVKCCPVRTYVAAERPRSP